MPQDAVLGRLFPDPGIFDLSRDSPRTLSWGVFSRPYGTARFRTFITQDYVLGYSRPSLRDSIWAGLFSGWTVVFTQTFGPFPIASESRTALAAPLDISTTC